MPPLTRRRLSVETTRHAFAYVFSGSGRFSDASDPRAVKTDPVSSVVPGVDPDEVSNLEADNRSLVLFDNGDEVVVQAGEQGIRFLLVTGKPLEELVAWYGPIVMNTREQTTAGIRRAPGGHLS